MGLILCKEGIFGELISLETDVVGLYWKEHFLHFKNVWLIFWEAFCIWGFFRLHNFKNTAYWRSTFSSILQCRQFEYHLVQRGINGSYVTLFAAEHIKTWRLLKLWVNLPIVDIIHPKSNMCVWRARQQLTENFRSQHWRVCFVFAKQRSWLFSRIWIPCLC